ncbi:bile acid:sodium symporter family protein [Sphingobacterium suaedae]|uniref:Bile acid:sodium symporter family protein n=1 Tax=Sphingobacterium suaedae TaxID=1686402 RepID=A0ABW5KEL9_9SPHI
MRLRFDGFIVALFLFILLAYLFPQLYQWRDGEILSGISTVGISLIFFFYGLKLNFRQMREGLQNWRLHVLVQSSTFILFPLLVLAFYPLVHNEIHFDFWLSFFFLTTLPSTVSSSVVMVSIARGNIPAAIFNASISGLIGVIVTPLWMQFFLDVGEIDVLSDVYVGLVREIVIPVILGMLLQRYFGNWVIRYGKQLGSFDKLIILLIVYGSFAESFESGIFDQVGTTYIFFVFLLVVALFAVAYLIIYVLSKRVLRFNTPDQVTALFCGSKKSLTHGSVFSKFLFAHSSSAGLYFLPLMLFHAFQILIVTIIAQHYANKANPRIIT